MPLDDGLVYVQLLDIQKELGVLTERTKSLPDLVDDVSALKQELHDHIEETRGHNGDGGKKGKKGIIITGSTITAIIAGIAGYFARFGR